MPKRSRGRATPSDTLAPVLDQSWRTAQAAEAATSAGLDDAQVTAILDPPPLQSEVIDPDDEPGIGTLVGFASAVLLFISITTFGNYVLTGVVEEKSTGVVEVLLSHVRAHQLLGGKVLGVGAVALTQFAAAVLAGLVSLRISGVDVPSELWVGLPATIGWFIGGFLLYSTLYALAGSFVSRVEDAQSAAAPISTAFTLGLRPGLHVRRGPRRDAGAGAVDPAAVRAVADAAADGDRLGVGGRDRGRRRAARGRRVGDDPPRRIGLLAHAAAPWRPTHLAPGPPPHRHLTTRGHPARTSYGERSAASPSLRAVTNDVIRIGLLGCGNVGGSFVELVRAQQHAVEMRTGIRLEITRVAVRNLSAQRDVDVDETILTRDAHGVVADPDVDLVVEAIGGIEPARSLILEALAAGKPVVTANKELLANVGAELYAAADAAGKDLLFEAAVAGGIPIMRALRESLHGEPIAARARHHQRHDELHPHPDDRRGRRRWRRRTTPRR